MGRERQTGDWAAWMGPAAATASSRVPEPAASGTKGGESATAAQPTGSATAVVPARPAGPVPRAAEPVDAAEPPAPDDPAGDLAVPGHDPAADAPRSARREATRRRVLDAAREVFAEMGVIGATVEHICERAGFTRGAFYSNFADKDDVIDALVEREQNYLLEQLDAMFGDVEREVASATDLASVLRGIIGRILLAIPLDRELTLVQAELENFAIRRPELAGRFLAISGRFRLRIAAFISDAMTRNGRELLVEPLILTDAIMGITQRSVRRALLDGGDADPNELAAAILPGLLLAFSRPVAES